MIRVRIHGVEARYTATGGWTCNDGLTERFLQNECMPGRDKSPDARTNEQQALALAAAQYPTHSTFEVLGDEPQPEPSQRPVSDEAPTEVNPQTTGQAQPGAVAVDAPKLGKSK